MAPAPPVEIATARLTLRPPQVADFPDMCRLWGDAEVVRFIGGHMFSAEEVWQRLLRYRGLWAVLGYGYWTIRDAATGDFVGEIGFADWGRQGIAGLDGRPECGWVLTPDKQGKGYAGEALGAALAWFDSAFAGLESACIINPDNIRSIRLASAHGFAAAGRAVYKGATIDLFVRPACGRDDQMERPLLRI
jgi:RimJ/RimL family protein N-acetyltransferase